MYSERMSFEDDEFEPLPQPITGRWIWNDEKNTIEFSVNTGIDSKDKRRKNKNNNYGDQGKKSERIQSSNKKTTVQSQPAKVTQPISRTFAASPTRQIIKQTADHTTVTLDDVKSVALAMLIDAGSKQPDNFEEFLQTQQFEDFLLSMLVYFNCFFERLAQERKPKTMTTEPSKAERTLMQELQSKMEVAQKRLAQNYSVLLLGLGLQETHHMACGLSRVSQTRKDRHLYEVLYKFICYVVWIVFKRQELELIFKEVGRMLRSDVFNPALRVKHATEDKKSGASSPKKEIGNQKTTKGKSMSSESRHKKEKRPAIKTVINQRSPVLISLLPEPKEDALWLFKRHRPTSAGELQQFAAYDDISETNLEILPLKKNNIKVGILGEPLFHFNSVTLAPIGSEENEENEEQDEQKDSMFTSATPQKGINTPGPSLVRQPTNLSQATTEAYSEGEDEE